MDKSTVASLVRKALADYRHENKPERSIVNTTYVAQNTEERCTIGMPWSAAKVDAYIEKLKAAFIDPYLQRFELRETPEQIRLSEPTYADFWVVAAGGTGYVEWYDPSTGEFGLGLRVEGKAVPVSIGIRGDLVGVFCAM